MKQQPTHVIINKIEEELLQIIKNGGNISIDDVQNKVNMMLKKKEAMQKHPYDIWQGSNGRWYTYLTDSTCKNGRKQIAKSSLEKIEEAIYKYYIDDQEETKKAIITFSDVYLEWLTTFKPLKVANGTRQRIASDYDRFYAHTDFAETDIQKITALECDRFLHGCIKHYRLKKKAFYNMAIVAKQVFEYAVKKDLILKSPLAEFELAKNMLRHEPQPDSKSQVFTPEEQNMIIQKAMIDFNKHKYLTPLAIALDFQLGLRNGELVTIKWTDIEGNYITIFRTEIKYKGIQEDGTKKNTYSEVKEWPKSNAGYRRLYLSPEAREILEIAKEFSIMNGLYSPDGYIFVRTDGRIPTTTTDKYLHRSCLKLCINDRSMHKIRKTAISALIDAGINLEEVRRISGHEDITTLLKSYCFNRRTDKTNEALIEKALSTVQENDNEKVS